MLPYAACTGQACRGPTPTWARAQLRTLQRRVRAWRTDRLKNPTFRAVHRWPPNASPAVSTFRLGNRWPRPQPSVSGRRSENGDCDTRQRQETRDCYSKAMHLLFPEIKENSVHAAFGVQPRSGVVDDIVTTPSTTW